MYRRTGHSVHRGKFNDTGGSTLQGWGSYLLSPAAWAGLSDPLSKKTVLMGEMETLQEDTQHREQVITRGYHQWAVFMSCAPDLRSDEAWNHLCDVLLWSPHTKVIRARETRNPNSGMPDRTPGQNTNWWALKALRLSQYYSTEVFFCCWQKGIDYNNKMLTLWQTGQSCTIFGIAL